MYPYPDVELDYLRTAVTTLRYGGRADIAESVTELIGAISEMRRSGQTQLTLSTAEEFPGWRAVAYFACRELYDPSTPRVGDRVRLTHGDANGVTGEWRYDSQPADGEHPHPYVLSDDTGERHDRTAGQRVRHEIIRRTTPADGWTAHLQDAATVVRSAWTTSSPLDVDDAPDIEVIALDGCHGCGGYDQGILRCAHTGECTGDRHLAERHQRTRWCDCGVSVTGRVIAWLPTPQHAPTVFARDTDVEFTTPEEVGGAGVCGPTCAQLWIKQFRPRIEKTLGAARAGEVLYRIDYTWEYEPNHLDLPAPLYAARTAARAAAEHLTKACAAATQPDQPALTPAWVSLATFKTSQLLDALVELGARGESAINNSNEGQRKCASR